MAEANARIKGLELKVNEISGVSTQPNRKTPTEINDTEPTVQTTQVSKNNFRIAHNC